MKPVLIYFFLLNGVLNLAAQQKTFTLSGYLRDSLSGETLPGANIYVRDKPQIGTSSNNYGFYSLSLPAGEYAVTFSYLGFEERIEIIRLFQDLKLDILFSPGVQLEELIVEENKSLEQVQSTDMGRVDLTTDQIKRMPALFGEVDVLKALQLLPGVLSADEGGAGFYVRGGGADQNLLLLDEAPVYNSGHLLGFFSVFNSDAIKHTSLIKGGMPAYYGGRLSSVVDIQMKEGNARNYAVEGGIGLIASRLTVEGPLIENKSSFIVSARRTYVLDLAQPFIRNTDFSGTNYYFYDLNAKVNHRFSDKDRIYLSGYFGRDILNYKSGERDFTLRMPYGNNTATLRWNHVVSNKLFMNTTAVYNGYHFKLSGEQDLFSFRLNNGVRDFQLKLDMDYYPVPGHFIRFGANVIHHRFTPNILSGASGETTFTNDYKPKYGLESAVFFQDEIRLNARLTANLGLRWSRFSQIGPFRLGDKNYNDFEAVKSFNGLEPRMFFTWLLNQRTSLKFGYSQNQQYIHLVSNSASTLPTDVWVPSSLYVKPQRGSQWSAGWYKTLQDGTWNLSVEAFYKPLRNQIDYRETYTSNQSTEIEEAFVFGKGEAYGSELFVQKSRGKLTGWLGYTFTRSWRWFRDIEQGRKFPASFDKPHDLELVSSYQASRKWNLSANFVYGTGKPFTPLRSVYFIDQNLVTRYGPRNSARYQDYHRADVSANYTPKPDSKKAFTSSWTFSVYNLYNRKNPFFINYDLDSDLSGGRAKATAYQVTLFPLIPSITWNFKWKS